MRIRARIAVRIRAGIGNSDNSYWEIIPSDNATFFYLKNKRFQCFLGSDETNVCLLKNNYGICESQEWMNNCYKNKYSSNTKWTITTDLIRYGKLPDRSN